MPIWTLIFPVAGIVMLIILIIENRKPATRDCYSFATQFRVPDYMERMDKLVCELSDENEFIPVELWWGCDGWRQKPDGTFERVERWRKPKAPEPIPVTSCGFNSLNYLNTMSPFQSSAQEIHAFQMQAAQNARNAYWVSQLSCNCYQPGYLYAPQMSLYTPYNACGMRQ